MNDYTRWCIYVGSVDQEYCFDSEVEMWDFYDDLDPNDQAECLFFVPD